MNQCSCVHCTSVGHSLILLCLLSFIVTTLARFGTIALNSNPTSFSISSTIFTKLTGQVQGHRRVLGPGVNLTMQDLDHR